LFQNKQSITDPAAVIRTTLNNFQNIEAFLDFGHVFITFYN